ncbi:hypothetical protein ABMS27_11885 [Lactiplantibacillus plantarum]|uniref:hypothetical protein n=1 Tax=Lactiplantibacillus plantarum TaxID=1590 RepID=UPI001B5D08EE|nr:hypothetical protein [Lactiplantibacillus plantarum]MBP5842142.1 hypothetical protein [Lactiplantibacillus plantarum]UNB86162.1 hypothetical protein LXM95_07450 [Lactiplantibacillus plantarum]
MSYDDKMSMALRLIAETFFFAFWLIILFQIMGYNDAVHTHYGENINFFNAFNFISFNQFEGLKLFFKSALMILLVLVGTIFSFNTSYNSIQTWISVILSLLNIVLIGKLVVALSNPVLLALFLLAIIGMIFSAML